MMMCMMLTLVVFGIFIPSSQTYVHDGGSVKCYHCAARSSEDCNDPFSASSSISTCTGAICYKAKYVHKDQKYVARGCEYSSSDTELGCIYATFADEQATVCYCDTAECNMATMTSSSSHVTMMVTLLINTIIAHLL